MADDSHNPKEYYDSVADSYSEIYQDDTTRYPSQRICRDLSVSIIESSEQNITRILDVGCGTGHSMYPLLEKGYDVVGFDFSSEMVKEAKSNLQEWGYDPDNVVEGDLADSIPFDGQFDAVIALGSVPTVPDPHEAVERIHSVTKPDGLVLLQLRNLLFNLYTLNEYTYSFFFEYLLDDVELSDKEMSKVRSRLQGAFSMDSHTDQKLSELDGSGSFHNPLTIDEDLASIALDVQELHFHHYHALPPEFENTFQDLMREQSLKPERPTDWKGYFMGSAFLVESIACHY